MKKKIKRNIISTSPRTTYYERIIEYGTYSALFLVPLLYSSHSWSIYELPKLTAVRIITLLFLSVFLIKSLSEKKIKISLTLLDLPIVFFLLVSIFATFFSSNFTISMVGSYPNGRGLQDIFTFILLYFLIGNILSVKNKKILGVVFLSSLLCSLWGIYQYYIIGDRVYSTFADPNHLGSYLALSLPLSLGYALILPSLFLKVIISPLIVLIFISLILCFSRAAWVAAGISLGIYLYLYLPRKTKKIILVGVSLFLLLGSITLVRKDTVREKILRTESIIIRALMWRDTLYLVRDNWVVGTGVNTFGRVFRSYQSEEYSKKEGADIIPDVPHNELLEVASNMGLLGLFSYLWLVICVIIKSIRLIPARKEGLFILPLLTFFIAYFINNLFGFSHTTTLLYFFVFLGIINTPRKSRNYFFTLSLSPTLRNIFLTLVVLIFSGGLVFIVKPLISDILFRKGMNLAESGELKKAIEICKVAISWNKKEDEYYILLADIYLNYAKNTENKSKSKETFENAVENINSALQISPEDPLYFYALGRAYYFWGQKLNKDKLGEAEYFFNRAKESDPYNPLLCYDLGVLSMDKGDLKSAGEFFQRAIELEPTYSEAYLGLANILYNQGKLEEAENTVKEAIKINPQDASPYYFLAKLYLKINKVHLAEKQLEKVIEKDIDGELSEKARRELKKLKFEKQ